MAASSSGFVRLSAKYKRAHRPLQHLTGIIVSGGNLTKLDWGQTSMRFFQSLAHGPTCSQYRILGYVPSDSERTIAAIHFYHNIVFVKKARNDEGSFGGRPPDRK